MTVVPRPIALFGTEEPVAAERRLRAGPLECRLDGGDLRHIRVAGREAIRAIAFVVRDRDWGTYAPEITGLHLREAADGFEIRYRARCVDDTQAIAYEARIRGDAGGLVFEVEAVPETDFLTNRTGFVVLHPIAGVAGTPVEITHTDGDVEKSRFPGHLSPWCPFTDIRAITHEVHPGLRVTCRMEGDAYEMEDQRNWTDASFKTYIRPLAKPWPYRLPAGKPVRQAVALELSGRVPAGTPASAVEAEVRIRVGGRRPARVPPLGLGVLPDQIEPALARAEPLRAAAPCHLSCRFDPRRGDGAELLHRYGALGKALGTPLLLEAVVPCTDAAGRPSADPAILRRDLERIAAAIAAAGTPFEAIAVTPACDLKCVLPGSPFPPAPSFEELAAAARDVLPPVSLGGGAFAFFTELNRKRPPPGLFDFVGHYSCPIFHAADDQSLMETLEALPAVFATARSFLGRSRYHLFPTAIVMRENPYGEAPAANPDNRRRAMSAVDPRERALIGAAWYAGFLARATEGNGPDLVTMAAPVGPAGVLHAEAARAQPWFDETDALVRPKYHVLRGFARLAGAPLLTVANPAPTRLLAFAAETATGCELWLANLEPRPLTVRIEGFGGEASATILDEESFALACRDPGKFDTRHGTATTAAFVLRPFAVARLRRLRGDAFPLHSAAGNRVRSSASNR